MLVVAVIICISGVKLIYSGTILLCNTKWSQENFDQLPSGQLNFARSCSYSKLLFLLHHWQRTPNSHCGLL